MDLKNSKSLILFLALFWLPFALAAQKQITVKGTVVDEATNEPLPFVNVYFPGTNIGTETDFDGNFRLSTRFGKDTLAASYLGYETKYVELKPGIKAQTVNFALGAGQLNLDVIVFSEKRGKYRRKGNPAVQLWRNVVAHADQNRPQNYDFYEYDKYEKVQLDLNNLNDKFQKRRALRKFKFIFDYADTSDWTGKTHLPIYIREAASKVYYRKDPKTTKEYRSGIKVSGLDDYLDKEGFNVITDLMYRNIDIYEENILIFDKQFRSPLGGFLANQTYRFYIVDTLEYNGHKVINLNFTPVTKSNIAFEGNLFILADSTYAVVKAEFGLNKKANLNFVNELKLVQEFEPVNDIWILHKDVLDIDFSPMKKSMGFLASRSVLYDKHLFDVEREGSIYSGTENVVDAKDAYERDDLFWQEARQEELTKQEEGVYEMIDTLQRVPAFRRIMNLGMLLISGYQPVGPVDIGPVGAFYSFNPVEGFRLRFGGQSNLKLNPKLQLEGYGAYGFHDKKWKYAGAIKYSFRDDFKVNPRHYLRLSYQHETKFVGQQLQFVQEDNFFFSFKRGTNDRMMFMDEYMAEYFLEFENNLSFRLTYKNTDRRPLGSLKFEYLGEGSTLPNVKTSQLGLKIRFAPNEQYIQGRNYRTPIYNKYPTFELFYDMGLKEGGDYEYYRLRFRVFKRFFMSLFGTTRMEAEAGRIWADGVPYFLLHLPQANQTFIYRTGYFNLMNFMEFASDRWVILNFEHFFEGFFFNKIPLLRKLKLREVFTIRGIYGGLDDENNPEENPELIQFLKNEDDGKPITYTLEDKPYIEASVGVYNIFKFGRLDLVQRLNYLDNPEVPKMFGVKGLAIRASVKLEF